MNHSFSTTLVSVISAVFVLTSSGCSSGSADKKVPELANEMCDCFSSFQQTLSPAGKELMKAVSVSANPQQEMIDGMRKMSPEEATAFAKQLASVGDRNTALFKCLEAFDQKHGKETTRDKKELTQKLLAEMQRNANCPTGAAVVNMNLGKMK